MALDTPGERRIGGGVHFTPGGSKLLRSNMHWGCKLLRGALYFVTGPPSQTPTSPDLHLRPSSVRIVKRIPRASRHLAATKLAGILGEVTDKNDITSWTRLSTFSSRCLALPKRGGQRRSLAAAVNAQLRDESELPTQPPHQSSEPRVTRDPLSNLAKRVSSKLEEGDFKGAVQITCYEDTMADLNEETLSALQAKHPPLHPDSSFPAPLEIPPSLFPLSEKEVVTMGQEARSFLKEVAHRIVAITNEPQTLQFLQQRVAVAVQRGNAASILGSAVVGDGSLIFS